MNHNREHYIGAKNEYLAASYYLGKGYQVYWPSMQQGSVDFVVEVQNNLFKVQVKTATWVKSGNGLYLQCRTRLTNKYQGFTASDLYDTLFIVGPDEQYWEIPSGLITSSNLSLKRSSGRPTKWDAFQTH